jgi:hypothetical protein
MNEIGEGATCPAEMLLREIERQMREEMRIIDEAAEREARTILAQAHAAARRRMRDAVNELRRDRALRVARGRAKIEEAARMRAQQNAAEALRRTWPFLIEALDARWKNSAARLRWLEGVAHYARDRLVAGSWTVEHPPGWSANDQRRICELLDKRQDDISFTMDSDITGGLRIRAGQATLDATSQGLLADRRAREASLLAEINSQAKSERPRRGVKK